MEDTAKATINLNDLSQQISKLLKEYPEGRTICDYQERYCDIVATFWNDNSLKAVANGSYENLINKLMYRYLDIRKRKGLIPAMKYALKREEFFGSTRRDRFLFALSYIERTLGHSDTHEILRCFAEERMLIENPDMNIYVTTNIPS